MKKISIVTPCYNEEANVQALYERVKAVMAPLSGYSYEHIFIDNASRDDTVRILKGIAARDKNVKIIVNIKNFGHIRSPYHGLLQGSGDAVVMMVCDLQDPPELLAEFVSRWEKGARIVVGVKNKSEENFIMFGVRRFFYFLMKRFAETDQIQNFTGYGLYDRVFVDALKALREPYPYFRGLITELGFDIETVPFVQPARKRGKTKNNFYTLYDMAMLGIISYSKIPLRLATFAGFFLGTVSFLVAVAYFIYKIVFWKNFQVGMAPIVIGLFFFSAVQLFFIGIIGEYIGTIFTQVKNRPLVIEKERINF